MKLTGIEIRNFRSIGKTPVVLSPLEKCNILIGQNNAGKSNAINAIQKVLRSFQGQHGRLELPELDHHNRTVSNTFSVRLHFVADTPQDNELKSLAQTDTFYFDLAWEPGTGGFIVTDCSIASIEDFNQANKLRYHLVNTGWPNQVGPDKIREEFTSNSGARLFLDFFASALPPVELIPEFREIKPGDEYTFAGANLVETLGRYKNPDIGEEHNLEKFNKIQTFIRQLLHLPSAELDVPRNNETIIISNNGIRLPLSYYGTGVHELVILVTAVLSIDNSICCIEEPEIHLHPKLQREFVEFIINETSNQYLISTHSPTFINTINIPHVQVFHLQTDNGSTSGKPVLAEKDSLDILHDLGVKASDVLQANCVIWVEGPSDRVYLNHWLNLLAPRLIEGLDYAVMFYGGRLLAHLSAERDTLTELIQLLKINQNAIVVMDSDQKSPGDKIRQTKLRVQQECVAHGGLAWITAGREIENYLPERVLTAACSELAGQPVSASLGRHDKIEEILIATLERAGAKSFNYAANKVRYAKTFIEHFTEEDISDEFREELEEIIAKIREWNV